MILFYDFTFWLGVTLVAMTLLQLLYYAFKKQASKTGWVVKVHEFNVSIFLVVLFVFVLRGSLFEPFKIPSSSMRPTLIENDFILVNKLSYGLKVPIFNYTLVSWSEVSRGDAIVFYFPEQPDKHYIKRVVGLPGDHISYSRKILTVNDVIYSKEFIQTYTINDNSIIEYKEKLPKREYNILNYDFATGDEGSWTVSSGHYFVMGDNRDNSNDSRYWGTVPYRNIVGKAELVWMHFGTKIIDRLGVIQ